MRLFMAILLAASLFLAAAPAFAEPESSEVTVQAKVTQGGPTTLETYVTYDPSFKQGEATRFTIDVRNSDHPIIYKLNAFEVQTSSSWSSIIDTSKYLFQDENYFDLEVSSAGNYRLSFIVEPYYLSETGGKLPVDGKYYRFEISFTVADDGELTTVESLANEVASQCLEACAAQGDTSDFAKAWWLNNWIADNTTYDWSGNYMSAEGVLARGTATCEGYHDAYSMLLNKVGIQTCRVPSKEDHHVWTGVLLDGQWYNVDTTSNDGAQSAGYPTARGLYFGIPSSIMKTVFTGWDGNYYVSLLESHPFEANAYENNYLIKSGEIDQYTQPYLNDEPGQYCIKTHLANKETSFTVPIVHTEWAGYKTKAIVYGLVAHQLSAANWGSGITLNATYGGDDTLSFTVSYSADQGSGESGGTTTDPGDQGGDTGNTGSTGNTGDQGSSSGDQGDQGGQTLAPGTLPTNAPAVSGSWVKSGSRWWYSYDAGSQAAQGKAWPAGEWVNISGKAYYFDGAGWMRANWNQQGDAWYWHGSDGAMKTGWVKVGGTWYFMNADGKMSTRWLNDGGAWYYLDDSSGAMTKNWRVIDGSWYHFKGSGAMTTGWLKSGKTWYYLGADGKMLTGMQTIGGAKYYLHAPNGNMATGWVKHEGSWYWFASSGAMQTGWVKTGGAWYFMNADGKMATRWLNDGGAWYYLDDSSGAMTKGWRAIDGSWYYFNGSGAMQTNKWIGHYYVAADGKMATDAWIDQWHVNAEGKWDATR